MSGGHTKTHRRVNIILPEETVRLIDRIPGKGDRSHFIDKAVRHYIEEVGKTNLRKQLKEGAIRRAERDLLLTKEWFFVEEKHDKRQKV